MKINTRNVRYYDFDRHCTYKVARDEFITPTKKHTKRRPICAWCHMPYQCYMVKGNVMSHQGHICYKCYIKMFSKLVDKQHSYIEAIRMIDNTLGKELVVGL
jgi:hypothetical protein